MDELDTVEEVVELPDETRLAYEGLAELLVAGVDSKQAAFAYGLTTEELEQLVEEDSTLRAMMAERYIVKGTDKVSSLQSYSSLEAKILDKLEQSLAVAECRELGQVLKIVHELNPENKAAEQRDKLAIAESRDKKSQQLAEAQVLLARSIHENSQSVKLVLPKFIVDKAETAMLVSSRNEIHTLNNQDLSPLAFDDFQEMLDVRDAKLVGDSG